jgi:DNA-binding transcriptional LysR family regulator
MYDFLDLKLIQYMNEESSLSAVAARARMSLPAVSQRLAKLEEHFDTKLLRRSGRFGLTPAGQVLFNAACNIHGALADAERDLQTIKAKGETRLRIACSDSVLIDDLPLVLDRLVAENPALRITVQDVARGQVADQLADDLIDVALVSNALVTSQYELSEYRVERACIVAPLSHPLSEKAAIPLVDALPYDFIVVSNSNRQEDLLESVISATGKLPKVRVQVQSIEALCALVAQTHLGIGLAYESAARRLERSQPIQVLRLSDPWAIRRLQAMTRLPAHTSAPTRSFVSLLTERFRTS